MDMRGNNRTNRAFSGIPTFLRSNLCMDHQNLDADFAIFGVPMDEGSPYMPGARFAPRTIREHSMRFAPTGFYDVELQQRFLTTEILDGRIVDIGDVDILPTNVEKSSENITTMVRELIRQDVTPIGIGGDHSVSYPIVRAFTDDVHIVQFDAHMDYAPISADLKHTNGQPFRHIGTMPNVQSITQIGIRSLRTRPAEIADATAHGNNIVTMSQFRELGPSETARLIPEGAKCYVSIDIDALDMSLTPGCVSAEPNGLLYHELRDTLIELSKRNQIVGFDLVEVNPQLDVGTGVTSYLAAQIMVEFLGHICANNTKTKGETS